MEANYYEVYNQSNVTLVDLYESPIDCITATGIKTATAEFEFDLIVYAIGFNAIMGCFAEIDIRGSGRRSLLDKWHDGPRTYLGLTTEGFPNLITLVGPHNAATFSNKPRCIEQNVEWVSDLIKYMRDNDYHCIAATLAAEAAGTKHVYETASRMLLTKVKSWFMGINSIVAGKDKPTNYSMPKVGSG
jgi:cation diffusion facilitator CzcD-associated flavoprotein CzcO